MLDGLDVPPLLLSYDVNKLHVKKRSVAPAPRQLLGQDFLAYGY